MAEKRSLIKEYLAGYAPSGPGDHRGVNALTQAVEAVKKWALMLSEAKHLHLSS